MKKKLVMALALVLIVVATVGLTLAWLTDTTDPVKNTFTTSDIDITLEESVDLDLKMVPGLPITKDPLVTVLENSEKCYLFVKVEKSTNFDDFLTYTMAGGWLADATLPENVYYRIVDASASDQEFAVLKDDEVVVKQNVTKAMMDGLTSETLPMLTFTAYASQHDKNAEGAFTVAEAWGNVNNTP